MRRCRVVAALALAFSSFVSPAGAQSATDAVAWQAMAVPVHLPPAIYPPIAQAARVQGAVEVIVTVRPNGSIASAVVAGRDIPILSGAALAAAAKAGFECRWCVGVSAQYSIVYQFTMGGLSHDVRLEPVCETAGRSRVTTWADSPICDHCGGHISSAIPVRSAKCGWLWKCGVRYR